MDQRAKTCSKDALSGTSDATRAFEAAQKSANAELAKTKGFLSDAALAQADLNDKLAVSQGKLSTQQAQLNKIQRDATQANIKDTKALFGERIKLDAVIAGQTKTVEDLQKKQAGFAANEQQTIKTSTANKLAAAQAELNASNKLRGAVQADIKARTDANINAAKTEIDIIKQDEKNDEQQKANDRAKALQDAANAKALEATRKAAEDQKKAREDLDKLANDAFVASLDEQSKVLNESNNKIIELEKTFAAARFKAGSEEEKKALEQQAIVIAEIRAKATADVAALEKTANEKLFKDKLEVAKAAEGATLQQQLAALEEQKAIELSFAETLGLSELEIATRYALAIGKVKTDIAAAAIETQINELKTLEIEEGSSLERRIALIRLDAQKRIDAAKGDADAIKLINAETQQAITEENKKETDKRIDLAVQYAEQVVNIFNALNDLNKVNSENRIAEITATSEAELNAINASSDLERDKAKQRLALEKRTQQGIANEKTKQARRDKALALFNIAVDTATSIIKTGAQLGYPAAIPFQVAAGIIGAIQLAAVAAKPLPKFEKGGLIGGKLHSQGGTMIEAEQGEYMVNRRQTARHRRELDAMNTSTEAFRRMIDEKYVRPALMSYSAGRRGKEGVTVNASLNSKSMEKELKTINKTLKGRNVVVNINQQDSRYSWQ